MNTCSFRKLSLPVTSLFISSILSGCPADEMTTAEAKDAVVEASVASQASSVAEGTIELTTSFTLGAGVEAAAEEIAEFAASQIPCADVERDGATVTITFGVESGCEYHGHEYTGSHTVTVSRSDEDAVTVDHTWTKLSNGVVEVSGDAQVTWDASEKSRQVTHHLDWTRLADGRSGSGSGERTQSALNGDWSEGIALDGSRTWEGDAGTWDLDIEGVEWRWSQPVPESGTYVLTTPSEQELTLTFARIDEDTIGVTVSGAKRDLELRVTSKGDVTE